MANEQSSPQVKPQPQMIPLAKIHDLPGVFIPKQPDKSYGGLVTSIQASGVKEAVILRLREDGEYQLVTGYRRRRASELAKRADIPAYVYEMTLQEAIAYHKQVQLQANAPVPGKLVTAPAKASVPDEKPKETAKAAEPVKPAAAPANSDKGKEAEKPTGPAAGAAVPGKENKAAAPKAGDQPKGPSTPTEKPKETVKAAEPAKPAATPVNGEKDKEAEKPAAPAAGAAAPGKENKAAAPPKAGDQPEAPAAPAEKPKEAAKPAEPAKPAAAPANSDKGKAVEKPDAPAAGAAAPGKEDKAAEPKAGDKPEAPATPAEKAKEAAKPVKPAVTTGPAAIGPAGTAITQVFEERLAPPDEKALKDLPTPKEGESFFIVLHPGYLEKSKFNQVSVDRSSEDYKELKKSIELNGVKDPVLTRINPEGVGLEIVSGQRRHMIARELNYPVPAIIQKLDDADVKILVNDGNLHRPHISTYDLARSLRGKMEGMKQKSGRRKKGEIKVEELDSDEKLAKEMGMSVSKLNRIIRLSEASKDVCDRVDDGSLALSTASALSFLKQENQDMALHLTDLGYKLPTERVEYLKKVEKAGKLDEMSMRKVLDGVNVLEPPKVVPMPKASPAPATPAEPPKPAASPVEPPAAADRVPVPPSPDVKPAAPAVEPMAPASPGAAAPAVDTPKEKDDSIFKGAQERPENTKVILTGDRLRKYFPDVKMTPREIEESVYDALEERRQRQEKLKQKDAIFKKGPIH